MVLFSAILYLDLPGFAESERMEIPDPYTTWPELLEETIFSQISGEFYFAGHSLGGGLGSLMSLLPGMKKRLKGSSLEREEKIKFFLALILLDPWGYFKTEWKNQGAMERCLNWCLQKTSG